MNISVAGCRDSPSLVHSRWADFVELTRPRLAVMVLLTEAAGLCLAGIGAPDLARLLHTVFGTALVVAGATALNQFQERHSDARMEHTRKRPLPSGRLRPEEVRHSARDDGETHWYPRPEGFATILLTRRCSQDRFRHCG